MQKIHIDCFIAAADSGSILAASKDLFLSPQTVSQHIKNLEEEVGQTLFDRSKSGVSLTSEGRLLYRYAIQWQGLYWYTKRRIEEYYTSIAASFSIGISEYVDVMGAISGGIAAFRDKHSSVSMRGQQYSNRVLTEKIANGSIDAGIIDEMQITAGNDFEFRTFAAEDLRLYISGYHPESPDEKPSIRTIRHVLNNLPHISTSYGIWNAQEWEEISHRISSFLGYDFVLHYESVNFRSCILNLKTIPCSVVCDARFGYLPENNDIFNIPLPTDTHLCIFWHKKNENPLIDEFADHMTDYYRS